MIQYLNLHESFPNGMLSESVYILYNEDLILGYISGKIRRSLIQTLPGDRIKIEIRQYYSFNQGTYNL
uniref:translational initiation factor 1 n=1 Tax=Allium plurifoliatum TaxID=743509 RepID=UPI001BEE5E0E|nr:translational initiation factor 1 [Allium plurifoliatum]YP_010179581.1 translational initiation factor 1 [Allium sikkimense]QUV76112.1 translational initiation factor 1 [Allium plurifoliatum]QUV76198.1 translational initiation factor 1 [Allium sikkimense]